MARKAKEKTDVQSWSPMGLFPDMDKVFENFRKDLERSFSGFPAIPQISVPKSINTSCDLIDEGNNLVMKVNMPGVKKEDIDLNITDNSVEISAEHKESSEEKKKNFLRKERSEVSYYRTMPLPVDIISGNVKAKLTDGVLSITMQKAKPTSKPKKNSIRVQ